MAQGDELLVARVDLGESDRRLVGLRARSDEEGFVEVAGGHPRELLGELDHRHRRVEGRDVAEAADLGDHRRVDVLVRVPDRDREDPAEEVEVFVAVEVRDPRALALVEDDGLLVEVGDGRKQVLRVLFANLFAVHRHLAPPPRSPSRFPG